MEEKVFIDREDELDLIEKSLKREGAELIVLYGRRRIGKSRLLEEVKKKNNSIISVMMEEADYYTNLNKFAQKISEYFNFPSFAPKSFREAFQNIPPKTILIIDEYSYISSASGEFQAIWEEIAKPNELKVVLSGSMIRIMEDLAYSIKSPLYGRATQVIKLQPLKIKDVYKWYDVKGELLKILEVYFSVGGVPRYLELIEKPSKEDIKKIFFQKNSLLLREGKLLLKESFPSSLIFPKIMFSIANGKTEATKIANDVNIKASEISKYLSILIDYGLVEKRFPVFGKEKKNVRFYMADRFFAFWTTFVWPYYGELETGITINSERKFNTDFAKFCGSEFEKTVMEILNIKNCMNLLKNARIGKQWGRLPKNKIEKEDNTYEIDILAVNEERKEILFGECKWRDNVDYYEIIQNLKKKAEFIDWNKGERKEIYAVFAKSFKKKGANCFDLNDLEKYLKT